MERSLSTYVAYIEREDFEPYKEDSMYMVIREKYKRFTDEKEKSNVSNTDS